MSNKIEQLVLSIATNQFTVPLPTGKEVVEAVNSYDSLRSQVEAKETALADCSRLLGAVGDERDTLRSQNAALRATLESYARGIHAAVAGFGHHGTFEKCEQHDCVDVRAALESKQ